MNRTLAVVASVLSAVALYLPTRTQAFTWVRIDSRMTRMLVIGQGHPTVVFENGLGATLEMWGKVQPEVSRFAQTVTYDRAGIGLSSDGRPPRDGRHIASELRRSLQTAGIAPPYVLVGASLGGRYIRVFAGMYPDEVSGMVFVDPTPDTEAIATRVPEGLSSPDTLEQARASRVPTGIPVFLIDAVSPREVPFASHTIRLLRMRNRAGVEAESVEHRRWLDTVPGSHLIVTHRSGHNVAIEQPDLVVTTIREAIVDAGRQARR